MLTQKPLNFDIVCETDLVRQVDFIIKAKFLLSKIPKTHTEQVHARSRGQGKKANYGTRLHSKYFLM